MTETQKSQAEMVKVETEVVVKVKRRQYTAEYKLKLLKEIDSSDGSGQIGAILRREGLYSSMLSKWKEQRENGSLTGLSAQKRGSKVEPLAEGLANVQRENDQLRAQLQRAELIIEVQKKVSQLLGLTLGESQPARSQ